MSEILTCPACGKRAFHSRYHPAEEASQFLWVKRPAKAAKLTLECLRCGWQIDVAPGTVRASSDVLRSLEFEKI